MPVRICQCCRELLLVKTGKVTEVNQSYDLDNVTIGTGSVVAKDVSSNTIVAGNSAQVIKKYNFDKEIWEKTKED